MQSVIKKMNACMACDVHVKEHGSRAPDFSDSGLITRVIDRSQQHSSQCSVLAYEIEIESRGYELF